MRPDLKAFDEFVKTLLGGSDVTAAKRNALSAVLANTGYLGGMLGIANELAEQQARALERAGYLVMSGLFELKSDGLVGIGGGPFKSIFEVGLNVDQVLGLPYYPGSGLKGAVRAYMEGELGKDLSIIFGEAGEEGHTSVVTFLDALPVGCANECTVYTGVVTTPHYFRGGKPVDTELEAVPVPVAYLGISRGLVFRITLGVNGVLFEEFSREIKKVLPRVNGAEDLLREVGRYTLKALREGIAAKAMKGYNVFEPFTGALTFRVRSLEFTPPKTSGNEAKGYGGRPKNRPMKKRTSKRSYKR